MRSVVSDVNVVAKVDRFLEIQKIFEDNNYDALSKEYSKLKSELTDFIEDYEEDDKAEVAFPNGATADLLITYRNSLNQSKLKSDYKDVFEKCQYEQKVRTLSVKRPT